MNDERGMSAEEKIKKVLIVDEDQELVKNLAGYLSRNGHNSKVATETSQALKALEQQENFDLVITGLNLPDGDGMEVLRQVKLRAPTTPVVVITSKGSVQSAVEAMKQGAADFLLKPVTVDLLEGLAKRMLTPPTPEATPKSARQIVSKDPRMLRLMEMARTVADSKAAVLIAGESGTGKELFARFLHENSSRSGGPFVAVNCASLPEGLLESELFGHEKGAFTGAISRKLGKFELASGGTILLDEISEMDIALQAKLLRVLQEGEIDRVGGRTPVPVDVRVISTSNRDLGEHIKQGNFREDLFYRLNVIPLRIPPLRERPGDLMLLAQHFLEQYAADNNRGSLALNEETKRLIQNHSWPGNVRELQNAMERAVLLCAGKAISPADLMFEGSQPAAEAAPLAGLEAGGPPPTLRDAEKELIRVALDHTDGNRTHAAKVLGISVRTLRNKLNEYKNERLGDNG
jgi:two-component system response regulator FlrC